MRLPIFGFGQSVFALALAGLAQRGNMARLIGGAVLHGPGRGGVDVAHKRSRGSKYSPHQGKRECERRLAHPERQGMPLCRLVRARTGGWTTEPI